ncbi:MAG TPA: hypothetical protein VI076_01770 [Actinopolymorphaceae bacterium]
MRPRMAPVGPMRASVYWRRRIVVLVASIVALWLLWTLIATALSPYVDGGRRGASSGDGRESAAASESTGGARPRGAPRPTAPRPTVAPSARPPARATTVSSPPARRTPSKPARKPTPPGPPVCETDDLEVTAVAVKKTVPAGFPVPIRLQVTNTSTRACRVDIGPRAVRIIVMTGSDRVWDTEHCPTAIEDRELRLAAGKSGTVTVVWNGRRSTPRCTDDAASSKPGAHLLQASVGGALSDPTSLTLR